MTPDQRAAWQASRLDQRCLDCGATSAASSWCYACLSGRLEYRTHAEQHDLPGSYWCGGRKGTADTRAAFATMSLKSAERPEAPAPVSVAISADRRPWGVVDDEIGETPRTFSGRS